MGDSVLERLTSLRQFAGKGERAPHKPLLVLLALGQLRATGSSSLQWSMVEEKLGGLLAEFGPPTKAGKALPSYPFTRLRADGVWELSREVGNDNVGPLREGPIEGHFPSDIEQHLKHEPALIDEAARALVESQFPMTVAPDVLAAVGLDPELILTSPTALKLAHGARKRDANWRRLIVAAWDRSCAFCGFDGALGGAPVGIEAAHVRWFNFEGPDELDNGLALCSLHHKLLDRGAIGLADPGTVVVSDAYSATSEAAKRVYELHGRKLTPRPGTHLPAEHHVTWHREQVFKGTALVA